MAAVGCARRLALIGLLTIACGEGAQPRAAPELRDEVTAQLRALGYVDSDEEADVSQIGVTYHDRAKSAPGLNLYTDDNVVRLMDLDGDVVRTWTLPEKRWCEHGELLRDGRLAVVCLGKALVVLEPGGRISLDVSAAVHHDVAEREDGVLLVPIAEPPRAYRGRSVIFDALLAVEGDGTSTVVWSSYDALKQLRDLHGSTDLERPATWFERARHAFRLALGRDGARHEYYHLNSVEVLPHTATGAVDPRFREGNLLISLRNTNSAVILRAHDLAPVWAWGSDTLDLPHMPTWLANGHLLVFDNGRRRGWSRVLEVDPVTEEVVWQFPPEADPGFYSGWGGSSQRLPNGNTLICESQRGHVIEVDPRGRLVWEFWNPDIREGRRRAIYRFSRIPSERGAALLDAGTVTAASFGDTGRTARVSGP